MCIFLNYLFYLIIVWFSPVEVIISKWLEARDVLMWRKWDLLIPKCPRKKTNKTIVNKQFLKNWNVCKYRTQYYVKTQRLGHFGTLTIKTICLWIMSFTKLNYKASKNISSLLLILLSFIFLKYCAVPGLWFHCSCFLLCVALLSFSFPPTLQYENKPQLFFSIKNSLIIPTVYIPLFWISYSINLYAIQFIFFAFTSGLSDFVSQNTHHWGTGDRTQLFIYTPHSAPALIQARL